MRTTSVAADFYSNNHSSVDHAMIKGAVIRQRVGRIFYKMHKRDGHGLLPTAAHDTGQH